ncbi:MPN domain-containing protein CG4751-like isoform X2 [Macrobrachium nipponense]|uniref:MPN domain-containing protein CG4751-like isoform X2 n=1 Tax=Macrobrachium nipponense TaxID=159736 RepID=UPI0030C80BF2
MSGETSAAPPEEIQIDDEVEEIEDDEEEEEVEEEDDDVEEEEEEEEIEAVTHGRSTGRGLTLKTLLKEGVLQPGEGTMTINYLGNKFKGDLLSDGRIRSQETNKIFGTPSAWAIYCKKIVNPDKKSGCGWASVRYRGKKLDSYKNNWYRQKRLEFEREGEALGEKFDEEEMTDSDSDGPHEQEIVEFELIGNRHPNHDMNTMVELSSFQSLGRMQPFNVTMSSSAMAVVDVHAHLSTSEVVGYLAGQWDVTNHNLIVSHALPVRCRLGDGEKGSTVEKALYDEMEKLNLSLVGWYHTHPFSPPLPTLRDIDSQLEYEMKMKGSNDASYTPCIGLIVSPYVRGGGQGATTSGFWVMPPPEHKPQEYGRPMSIQFTIVQDAFIPKDALHKCVRYYKDSPDSVIFTDIFQDRYTYWDKLKTAIKMCVPKDHYGPLIEYLAKLLELKNFVNEANIPPLSLPPPSKPKTPLSNVKPPDSPEVVPLDDDVSSTSAPAAAEMLSEAVNEERIQTISPPNSVCTVDSASEPPGRGGDTSPPTVQQMDVTYNQEHEKSPRGESPQNTTPEPEPKPEFQPITYREQSPPPYQPPPYQSQFHPPPYQPPQDDTAYQEQNHKLTQQNDYYADDYRTKSQEKLSDYDQDEISEEPLEYTEPPPDYHQQHFTISSSTFEPSSSEPYVQEDPKSSVLSEESTGGNIEPEDEPEVVSEYPESIPNDRWTQRLSETMQQSSHQSHSLHQQSSHQLSHQLHQQSQPHQQSQSLQLHQQQQSHPMHQQQPSQQRHQQLQSQDLLQQQSQDLHTPSHSQHMHQQPQSQPQSLHQQSQSIQHHQQTQPLQLHQQSQSLQLQPQPLQLLQNSQIHQPSSQSQQLHQLHQDDLQAMDIDAQISQSQNI